MLIRHHSVTVTAQPKPVCKEHVEYYDEKSGKCAPVCKEHEYFDEKSSKCAQVPKCKEHEYLDEKSYTCKPAAEQKPEPKKDDDKAEHEDKKE